MKKTIAMLVFLAACGGDDDALEGEPDAGERYSETVPVPSQETEPTPDPPSEEFVCGPEFCGEGTGCGPCERFTPPSTLPCGSGSGNGPCREAE